MPHFTYAELDSETLTQGNILKRTESLLNVIGEVHPHYVHDDHKYFIILTQSCDLVRRDQGSCKSRYITVAVVRGFSTFLSKVLGRFQQSNFEKGSICDAKKKGLLEQFLERLFNNNESEYFYLEKDVAAGFESDCVAFLKLSIALKADLHYDTCLEAKSLELSSKRSSAGWSARCTHESGHRIGLQQI